MNIRYRIILLVVLTFLAISLIGSFAVYQSRGSAIQVKVVTKGVVPSSLATAELVGQLKDVQLAVMTIVSATDLKLAALAEDRLLATQARLQRAFDDQLNYADSNAQRGLLMQVKENLTNYYSAIKDTIGFKLKGNNDMAEANLAANVSGYLQEMEQVVETLQVQKRRSKDDAIAGLNDNLNNTTRTTAFMTVIAVLCLSGAGLLLYRQIIHPIREMELKMTEIASSQDFSQRLPVHRMDEVGHSMIAFNSMVEKIQESTELVKQKTADIRAMLQYVPQGILTVECGNRIHPEYSDFLESILETKDIAGRNLMDVVFSETQCNADQLSQIETAVSACIDQDMMDFSFNEHLLVNEVHKTMMNGCIKILDLNWSPITDENGITRRILLCVRDVTDVRALATRAQEQKRELNIVGEILAVKQEKFYEFVQTAIQFIEDNRAIIENTSDADLDADRTPVITKLFRNMHTIKGNARTYGLLHLTHVVHVAEQTYDSLRQNSDTVWDSEYMLTQLDAIRKALDEYVNINEIKLGRKGPGRRADVDKFMIVDKPHIDATLALLNSADLTNMSGLREALRQTRHNLELMGTEPVEEVLAGVLESLPSLARELGKEPPVLGIQSHGIMLRNQVASLLKNVFMHLYRNAVDHGLETAAERMAHGKSPVGQIQLTLNMQGDQLAIRLQDDGRGLALDAIRRKAQERQLILPDEVLTPERVAQLVLQPGFSTAKHVTEVSGRGVGMDAVKSFVQAEGGSIALVLLDATCNQEFLPFETLILLPGKFAVAPVLHLLQRAA